LKNRSSVILSGALAGGVIAIALLVLFAGRYAMETVGLTGNGDAELAVTSGALYLASVIASLLGGVVVAAIAYGAGASDPESETRFELAHIMPFALVAAVAAGYSVLRSGVGLAGDNETGVVTITVAALGFTVFVAGLVAGGLVAWVVATLAAKSVVGLEGEAAPANTAAMMKAAMEAVTGPMLAIAIIAVLAISLAQLLLATEGVVAIAIFGGAAALVLLGAAGAAYLGGPKNSNGATD
jgi:hypothetical protein